MGFNPSTSNDHNLPPPDRVTFYAPNPLNRSASDLNPSRFALQRLGITTDALDTLASEEIDTTLLECLAEKCLNRLFPPDSLTSPTPRILTREDCLQLFTTTGVPTFGSLLGIYRWAANLGESRFNIASDFSPQSITLLDAYD